jgi:hypothetical protein
MSTTSGTQGIRQPSGHEFAKRIRAAAVWAAAPAAVAVDRSPAGNLCKDDPKGPVGDHRPGLGVHPIRQNPLTVPLNENPDRVRTLLDPVPRL